MHIIVGYLRNDAREAFQENEALWSRSMIMLGPHYFCMYSRSNDYINTKTLSQSMFQGSLVYGPHQLCYSPMNSLHQFYDFHCRFYD